jgi:hypothetical protein
MRETREQRAARDARNLPKIRRAEQEARISREMHDYLTAHGARETEFGHGNVRDYELDTLHGPARVTVVADDIGDPWVAVMFKDVARAVAAMPGAVHRQDLNRFSGKYNCHPIGLDGETERILAAFRRHLAPFLLSPAPARWVRGNVPYLTGQDAEGYVRGPFGIRCGSRQSSKPWALIHLPSRLLTGEYRLLAEAKAAADAYEAQPGIDWAQEKPLDHLSWDQKTALRKIAGTL